MNRLKMSMNRLKPHFVNNIMTSIYYLCEIDPLRAQKTSLDFSGYLLSTLDTIGREDLIPFSRELELIKKYLSLEELRLEDRLTTEFDIETDDFKIYPMMIQALVENSVKHGIAGKQAPGRVSISTGALPGGGVRITIKDDGTGFDAVSVCSCDPEECELSAISDLIENGLGGSISINSRPGKGTVIIITLP